MEFTSDGIEAIAATASQLNSTKENIGARRLNTVLAQVVNTISFEAAERVRAHRTLLIYLSLFPSFASCLMIRCALCVAVGAAGHTEPLAFKVDADYVKAQSANLLKYADFSRYVM